MLLLNSFLGIMFKLEKSKLVHFRVDLNSSSGYGHLARTLPLAEELQNRGWRVTYSSNFISKNLRQLELLEGWKLSKDKDVFPDLLVTDLYSSSHTSDLIRSDSETKILSFIDQETPPGEADLYYLASPVPKWEQSKISKGANSLFGFSYTQIRQQLIRLKAGHVLSQTTSDITKVGITLGGSEFPGIMEKLLVSLEELGLNLELVVISNLPLNVNSYPTANVRLISKSTKFMEELMVCDLVLCSASLTALELIYLNVPVMVFETVTNQAYFFHDLISSQNIIGFSFLKDDLSLLSSKLSVALTDLELVRNSIIPLNKLIDGKGSVRLADAAEALFLL